jgi:hypothetical protein
MLEKPGIPGTLSHSWLMDGYYPTYGKPIRWCPPSEMFVGLLHAMYSYKFIYRKT